MRNTLNNGKPSKKDARRGRIPVHVGSDNVFADLGLPQPDLALAKAKLVQQIRNLIAKHKLTQMKAAALLGIDQPKISALVRGRVARYSIDRLFRFLNLLGQRVEISVRPVEKKAMSSDTRVVVY